MRWDGILPAAITPVNSAGEPDEVSFAKRVAWFEAAGCHGVVVAGTTGEGPSLSAVQKRDLLRVAVSVRGRLSVVLGIATPALHEYLWLQAQAAKVGADAILLMPPTYYRDEPGATAWLREAMDAADLPVVLYHFPRFSGYDPALEVWGELLGHANCIGLKDSSGQTATLAPLRQAVPDKLLLVGDERLFPAAKAAGWTGSISGAANLLAYPLAKWWQEPSDTLWARLEPALCGCKGEAAIARMKSALAHLQQIPSGATLPGIAEADDPDLANLVREWVAAV